MTKLKVRGLGWILLNDDILGRKLKHDFDNGLLPPKVVIDDNRTVDGKDVTAIFIEPDQLTKNDTFARVDEQYYRDRQQRLNLSPTDRAKSLRMFGLLWYLMRGNREISPGIARQAQEIQRQFFEENPLRTLCDPGLFEKLTGSSNEKMTPWTDAGLRVIERAVSEDMWQTKRK